eukprot:6211779-Pleurochrysis_carterae.AAC.3
MMHLQQDRCLTSGDGRDNLKLLELMVSFGSGVVRHAIIRACQGVKYVEGRTVPCVRGTVVSRFTRGAERTSPCSSMGLSNYGTVLLYSGATPEPRASSAGVGRCARAQHPLSRSAASPAHQGGAHGGTPPRQVPWPRDAALAYPHAVSPKHPRLSHSSL